MRVARLWCKNSFIRHRGSYALVLTVLVCAAFTLAFFSAYADSVTYGEELTALAYTGGAHFVLDGADEADLAHFDDLDGLRAWYESDRICLAADHPADADRVADEVARLARAHGLHLLRYEASVFATTHDGGGVSAVKLIFTALSLVAIYHILTVFLDHRAPDLRIFRVLGMKRSTMLGLLAVELAALTLLATAIAIPLAGVVLRGLIDRFFARQIALSSIGVVVWRFSWQKMLTTLALTLAATAVAFAAHARRLAPTERDQAAVLPGDSPLTRAKTATIAYPATRIGRRPALTRIALTLVLPIFLCGTVELCMTLYRAPGRAGDFIVSDPGIADVSALAPADIDRIAAHPAVASLTASYYNNNFTCGGSRVAFVWDASLPDGALRIDEGHRAAYPVGSTVTVRGTQTGRSFALTPDGAHPGDGSSTPTFACSPATFATLTGIVTGPRAIALDLRPDATEAELADLRRTLVATFGNYHDERRDAADQAELIARRGWIYLIQTTAAALAAIVSLIAVLCFDLETRRDELRILARIGAGKTDLHRLVGVEMLLRGGVCGGVCLGAGGLTVLVCRLLADGLSGRGAIIAVLLAGGILLLLALFLAPTQLALSRILRQSQPKEDNPCRS